MAQQLTFDLPPDVRQGPENFFVSAANEQAFAMVRAPQAWPQGKLALVGPAGSGKTHLARVFAQQTGAAMRKASDIDPASPLPETGLILEDTDHLPKGCEEWCFHAHNHLAALGLPLLVTGQTPPARWPITLPDLASRLAAATVVAIRDPDDALLLAVLLKHFADRQIAPAPDAVAYLQKHLPRSFSAVADAVERLDRAALAQGHAMTRPFVRRVLDSAPPDGS